MTTFAEAERLLYSLRFGDTVRVTRDGRTEEVTVTNPAHYADGPHGAYDSLAVTVSHGPGRYAFDLKVLAMAEPRQPGLVVTPQTVEVVRRANPSGSTAARSSQPAMPEAA